MAKKARKAHVAKNIGLPAALKAGVEQLSGLALNRGRTHTNSAKPAQLKALAYAQGAEINLKPGQGEHAPNAAWKVVQKSQGRVAPTRQAPSAPGRDDFGLEQEARRRGVKARRPEATRP
jgi:hypothetical protein